mmetsp:Transcript_14204/g.30860  ORF Transcript_14204/g.30860 Transcript_14204/m.30860 type:complete len:565 (+) Transcript_14204:84-1778(+)|eukprot:CAMPEP_0172299780 /NCGR_PEP_ID=MMETSP1058-20130122/1997_1 /TAXON_ID=83371 /ORGANISM="Detonula confervacea, Strain CCMP 353" /LENGTH=564 /DNA_ID=CAMNT_0013009339 /DNA_START=27 /DNA_END=1721 /DNA_ORIENTATION=+
MSDEGVEFAAPVVVDDADLEKASEPVEVGTASAATEQQEDGTAAVAGDAAAKSQQKKWWQQKEVRLFLLLILIGGIVGLVVGLVVNGNNNNTSTDNSEQEKVTTRNNNDDTKRPTSSPVATMDVITPSPASPATWMLGLGSENPDDTGACASPTTMLQPVVDDRGSCTYQKRQTVLVNAPVPTGNATVEKKLSGGASAFDGENAVIVSYNGDGTAGAVWALSKGGDDNDWEQTAMVQTDEEDQLGWGISIKGDTFVVGAPGHEGKDIPLIEGWYWAGTGRAVVMAKNDDGGWDQQAILSPEVADDNAAFGSTVDIAECGCLIAVGAWHDRDSRGSVYVFSKTDDGEWTEIQKLAPNNTRRSQSDHLHGNYGYTVAINDDYLAVKAPYDSYVNSYELYDQNRGMVHIYKRGSNGTYEQIEQLCTPAGTQVRAHLTDMIFVDDFLLVGAPGKNKVYVFQQKSDPGAVGYEKTAELTPSDGVGAESNFGIRLDGKGTNVMVGDLGGETSYLFSFEDGVWKERAKFDGVNTSLSGNSIVEHTPKSFEVNGEQYGGEVNFYDLVCESGI